VTNVASRLRERSAAGELVDRRRDATVADTLLVTLSRAVLGAS
jgi:hypothetical protein